MIITGDDDSGSDCMHNGFDATVDVGYVLVPEDEVQEIAVY